MITENLSTLKIHKLTKAQYERELNAGRIDQNALYLTPDDSSTNNGSSNCSKIAETALQKYRSILDTKMSPWLFEENNIKIIRESYECIEIRCTEAISNRTEYLLGYVTFVDTKYGYMIYNLPTITGMSFEMRCGDKVYSMADNYIISEYTDSALWEEEFKDKTYEIYMIIETNTQPDDIHYLNIKGGFVYECCSTHDISITTIEGSSDIMYLSSSSSAFFPSAIEETINGITFTVNDDGIYANGTSTDYVEYTLGDMSIWNRAKIGMEISSGIRYDLSISTSPSSTISFDKYVFALVPEDDDSGFYIVRDGARFDNISNPLPKIGDPRDGSIVFVIFKVAPGVTFNNQRIHFNATLATVQLKNFLKNIKDKVDVLETTVANKFDNSLTYNEENTFNITAETQTIDGITFTINDDNSVTITGSSTSSNITGTYITLGTVDPSDYPYGCMCQIIGDNIDGSRVILMGDSDKPNKLLMGFTSSLEYQELIYNYIIINVDNMATDLNYTIKPVIYKCERTHDVIKELRANGGGSGITMDEVENYVNSQIGLAIGGSY